MNCIFQYWLSRPVLPGAEAGAAAMAAYAKMVGADYRFDRHDPYTNRLGVDARWFDKLRPVYDPTFRPYERVLVCDVDVFPVEGITDNIFMEAVGDFGMCEEPDQPWIREKFPSSIFSSENDKKWAAWCAAKWGCKIPKDDKGRVRQWNAGLILFSAAGVEKMRSVHPQPKAYVESIKGAGLTASYATEQCFLNALAFSGLLNFTPLSVEYNRQVHGLKDGTKYDRRTADTKFVHVQERAADHNDAAWHHRIVNSHRGQS